MTINRSLTFLFKCYGDHRDLHSFPTRRSSDLGEMVQERGFSPGVHRHESHRPVHQLDRKSTRLNSSHVEISYAVFCLKKKKQTNDDKKQPHIARQAGHSSPSPDVRM